MTTATLPRYNSKHWFTGLEPAPLHHRRLVDSNMADVIDNISTVSDDLLAESLPKSRRLAEYSIYSIVVFYHNCECETTCKCDPCNNAGYIANYTSMYNGRPAVHQYGWDTKVCWSARDHKQAEQMRCAMRLTRYALFTRILTRVQKKYIVWHWEYHHSGQLPLMYVEV